MANDYLSQMFSLQGRTALVTGGTGGMGSEVVLALVKAGAAPIISFELPNDPLSSALQKKVSEAGGELTTVHCDLGDSESLRAAFEEIDKAGLSPDILVNAAGVMRRNSCVNATDEELELLLNVNWRAFYVSMQEFGRRLLARAAPGKIVNFASVTSYQAGFNTSVYSSTKGAVLQMTKAFSNEWAGKGIQVNCVAPGFIKTDMTAEYQESQQMTDYIMTRVPMGRWGEPADLIAAILYLVAPSNSFMSGACLIVDGGFCGK